LRYTLAIFRMTLGSVLSKTFHTAFLRFASIPPTMHTAVFSAADRR